MATNRELKVAAAQVLTDLNVAENARKIEQAVRAAASQRCDVVLFHEGALSGYPPKESIAKLNFASIARAERRIAHLAGRLRIAVLLGTARREDGKRFNDLLVIDEKGRMLGRYSKTWRAGEPWYAPGTGPVIFTVAGVQATAIICHDLRYPELVRLGVAAGARIVFIANNEGGLTSERKLTGYRAMQISRGTENMVFAVMCNAPADPKNVNRYGSSHGNSMIVDPLGNVLDEAGWFEERLVTATINLREADASTIRRVIGESSEHQQAYGMTCEHPAIREWMRAGLKLVTRLNGDNAKTPRRRGAKKKTK